MGALVFRDLQQLRRGTNEDTGCFIDGAGGLDDVWTGGSAYTEQRCASDRSRVGSEDNPARVSGAVMAGLIVDKVDPEYPQAAKDKKISGAIVMMAKVDTEGRVADLKAISGPEVLRDAALTAVRQWTYKPYLLNGQPVYVATTVTVTFSLQQ
jgi:TonB family protein